MRNIENAIEDIMRTVSDHHSSSRELLAEVQDVAVLERYILRIANLFHSVRSGALTSLQDVLQFLGLEWLRHKVRIFCQQYRRVRQAARCRAIAGRELRLAWHGS